MLESPSSERSYSSPEPVLVSPPVPFFFGIFSFYFLFYFHKAASLIYFLDVYPRYHIYRLDGMMWGGTEPRVGGKSMCKILFITRFLVLAAARYCKSTRNLPLTEGREDDAENKPRRH